MGNADFGIPLLYDLVFFMLSYNMGTLAAMAMIKMQEVRGSLPHNKKTCPKGKSKKKEYSAHRLMVEISGIEPLTYAAVNAA